MTTRREFASGSLAALLMAFLTSATAESREPQSSGPLSDDELIQLRDCFRDLSAMKNDAWMESPHWQDLLSFDAVANNLDHIIMRRCCHDPSSYLVGPDEVIGGQVYGGHVTCSACRATTYAMNAKEYAG